THLISHSKSGHVRIPNYLPPPAPGHRARGPTIPLETAVRLQTRNTAESYGLADRGTPQVGKKVDINVIDFDALGIGAPEMVEDLPAGGRGIVQSATGYRYTICSGETTFVDGRHTGALPGKLVRGGARNHAEHRS
ncbi:MAG: amidohydrolase family protein, partial [Gammaproteobacteria bacterium]|nr:amidohydrolase family protein [Gammaproteobacteria bacterium]